MKYLFLLLIISFIIHTDSFCQDNFAINLEKILNTSQPHSKCSFEKKIASDIPAIFFKNNYLRKDKNQTASSTFPIAIGVASFLYLFNPIILFENDKIALGFTKEFSVGFGYFGEHRIFAEYSYIFRKDLNSNIRFGYNYDFLLKPGLKPSNLMQGSPTISIGGGYFNNFSRPGYFAQTTYGYSIRNDKFLFYPNLKVRFTYVAKGSNVFDLSFGIIIGIANPFIDLKIKNNHENDSD